MAYALLGVLVLAALTGCSTSGGTPKSLNGAIGGVEVSGKFGTEPTVRIATPLKVPSTRDQLVITGSGPQIQIDQLFVLQLALYNARTGKQVASTTSPGQAPVVAKSSDDTLFPALVAALLGKPQGSRVVVALSSADAFGSGGVPPTGVEPADPVVVVADVLAVPPLDALATAEGAAQDLPPGAPSVTLLAGDPTAVAVSEGATAPTAVTVINLIQGTGAPVRDHSLVTLDYLGQDWGSRTAFVNTYYKEPAVIPVGAEGSVPSWDTALVGLRAGSRVLVIDPRPDRSGAPNRVPGESTTAEHGTIAWVIDVLGVS